MSDSEAAVATRRRISAVWIVPLVAMLLGPMGGMALQQKRFTLEQAMEFIADDELVAMNPSDDECEPQDSCNRTLVWTQAASDIVVHLEERRAGRDVDGAVRMSARFTALYPVGSRRSPSEEARSAVSRSIRSIAARASSTSLHGGELTSICPPGSSVMRLPEGVCQSGAVPDASVPLSQPCSAASRSSQS